MGERNYQKALLRHFRPVPGAGPLLQDCTFELVPEPDNPYDDTAVSIRRNDDVLGYLPAEVAEDYFPALATVAAKGQLILASGTVWAKRSAYDSGIGVNLRVNLPSVRALAAVAGGRAKKSVKLPRTYQRKNPTYRKGLHAGADQPIVGTENSRPMRTPAAYPARPSYETVLPTHVRDAQAILGETVPASTFPLLPAKSTRLQMWRPRPEAVEKLFTPVLGDKITSEELVFELVTEPDNPHQSGAISVRLKGEVLGYLSEQDTTRYAPALNRIQASGQPVVLPGALTVDKWQSSLGPALDITVKLALPAPEHLVPLNAGHVHGVVLPSGTTLQVVGEEDHFDHLFNYVPPSGEGPLLLELRRGTQQLRTGGTKDTVRVYLDGEEVGGLTPASSAHFAPTLRHLEDFDQPALVWGRIQGSALKAALTLQAAKAHEIPDAWLQHPPQVDYTLAPENDRYALPDAYVPTPEEQVEQRRREQAETERLRREQEEAEKRRREDQEVQRRQQEAARLPAPAPTPPTPGWTPNSAEPQAAPAHNTTSSAPGVDYSPAASAAAQYAGPAPSAPPAAPKRPGIISLILMWLGFVGALAVFAEPISGLVWLALGIFTWKWRKKRRQAFRAYQTVQGTPAPYGSSTGMPTHR
ncbi:HIRAN domain-containing protein [Kocuria sp. KH4]